MPIEVATTSPGARGRRDRRRRALPHFDEAPVRIADQNRAPARRVDGVPPSVTTGAPRVFNFATTAPRSRTVKTSVGAPGSHGLAGRSPRATSKNSDSSSPNGVLGARMKTVRKREP
jgi:hypothetical protein